MRAVFETQKTALSLFLDSRTRLNIHEGNVNTNVITTEGLVSVNETLLRFNNNKVAIFERFTLL